MIEMFSTSKYKTLDPLHYTVNYLSYKSHGRLRGTKVVKFYHSIVHINFEQ